MAIRLATATRNALADAAAARVDAGSGAGTIEIRTGTQPAAANDAATGTLLATVTLNDPSYGSASSGVATLSVSPSVTATGVAAGTAGWCRVKDSAGNTVLDGSVTVTDGGGDFQMSTTTVSIGLVVTLTSGSITMPAA